MFWENWKPYIFNVATCPIRILTCLQWGWHVNNLQQPKIDKNFTGDNLARAKTSTATGSSVTSHRLPGAHFEWHCHILCEMIMPTFQTGKKSLRYLQQASRRADTFTGHFFNEKEAKLVCLVLPAGCHYGPLESSLRESAGPIVPKVPRSASWGTWLPLSTFTAQTCLGDRFPRQRHRRATYFFSVLCWKRQARRGYPWVHPFRPLRAIG